MSKTPNKTDETKDNEKPDAANQTTPKDQYESEASQLRHELRLVTAELDEANARADGLNKKLAETKRELEALRKQVDKPAKSGNPNKRLVRTASGREFWRAGEKFDGEWREIERTVIGDEAWQRIIDEPALQTKEA